MTRQERNALHKKQERMPIGSGLPSITDMKEGVPQLRNVHGKGLTEFTKYNGVLHEKVLEESAGKKSEKSKWYDFTFENSWVNYGSTWQTAQYSIDSNGFVHLRGLINDGSTSADITSLPTGFQPVMDELFVVRTSAGTSRVDIKTDGDVYANPGHATWTSLSGIIFEGH